jgi:hypothetical protein
MEQKIIRTTEINSFYVIVSGLLRFDLDKINREVIASHYTPWKNRIFDGDFKSTFDYLNHSYYDSYLNNIFPEIRYAESPPGTINPKILNHLTLSACIGNPEFLKGVSVIVNEDHSIPFRVEYADLYLFPHEIGIFSLKICLTDKSELNLGAVSDFLNKIRHLSSEIMFPEKGSTGSVMELIENDFLKGLNLEKEWSVYNPQLKTYTLFDLKNEISEEEMDYLLYDMGNIALIGSSKGEGIFAPSESYFKEQIDKNKISVFRNWSALALFDTFTRISMNFPDQFRSWEYDYFNLYIHCLYIKFFMYLTNSELSDVTVVSKQTEKLRDKFIEFINDYHHSHISYKFLPDLLQDKLLFSLEIQSEVERMETKIIRINEHFQERREKSFNIALIIITLLSVFSVLYDISEWVIKMGVSREFMYPYVSITNGIIIFLLIFIIFRKRNK